MTDLQGSLEEFPWNGAEWAQWRDTTAKDVADHALAIATILDTLEAEGEGGPLHWETMKPARRATIMESLDEFVHFLDRTYFQYRPDLNVKPCWWQHPDVVWQLTALWAAFGVAYRPSARPSTAQADFHERYLWPMLERLRMSSLRECNTREHKPAIQKALGESRDLARQLEQWKEGSDVSLGAFNGSIGGSADGSDDPDGDGVHGDEPQGILGPERDVDDGA